MLRGFYNLSKSRKCEVQVYLYYNKIGYSYSGTPSLASSECVLPADSGRLKLHLRLTWRDATSKLTLARGERGP